MTAKEVELTHYIPGRVRVRISKVKGNASLAEEIRQNFSAIAGIHKVEANPLTGSVLVEYDPQTVGSLGSLIDMADTFGVLPGGLDSENIEQLLDDLMNGLQKGASEETPGGLDSGIKGFFGLLNDDVARLTGGAADLRTLVPLMLFGFGLRDLLFSEKLTPPTWYNYFWFAFGTFNALNRSERRKDSQLNPP
jgi:Heavy metal associated domain 2